MVIKRSSRKSPHAAKRSSSKHLSSKVRTDLKAKAKKLLCTMKTPLKAYRDIEHKIDTTWKKLRSDVKRRSRSAILKGRRDLLLLLGECNYMARECARRLHITRR